MSITVVLASASPARRALLASAGVEPLVQVSDVDEDAAVAAAEQVHGPLEAGDVALLPARAKAEAVAGSAPGVSSVSHPNSVVIGCDSVLELGGEIHGKPASSDQAIARWQQMRGNSGVLHTGHWLIDCRDRSDGGTRGALGASAATVVHFADLDDDEIAAYVATGEPLQVAGAFTLDGLGAPYVLGVEGDPSTVIGLSLPTVRHLMLDLGIAWRDLRTVSAGASH